jgi:hypothetical protein
MQSLKLRFKSFQSLLIVLKETCEALLQFKILLPGVCGITLMLSASCDKNDNDPSPADFARCAHIDRTDTVWGEFFYDVCLNNPWPTELPPATQEGLSTFGGIINDTLLFVAGSPRGFAHETATIKTISLADGSELPHRNLFAGMGTYDAIDSSSIICNFAFLNSGLFPAGHNINRANIRVSTHDPSIDGYYLLDTNNYVINVSRWDSQVVAGTLEAWFIDVSNSSRRLQLSEARFDLKVRPQ